MSGHLIDDSPLTSFHKKLALYSSGGPFIDGYALTIVGVALITLEPALSLTSTEVGLIGAASLVGVFVDGMLFRLSHRPHRPAIHVHRRSDCARALFDTVGVRQ